MAQIRHFTELIVWQKGHKLVLITYKITETFPAVEKFRLVTQMNGSVISITSNISEGFGRRGIKDKIRFYDMAVGSLFEFQNQLIIARDLTYISQKKFAEIYELSIDVLRLINALISSINFSS